MANVRSLGLHEPSALDHLLAEGILKKDPSPTDYQWRTYAVYEDSTDAWVEEEILRTESCVVWSRGGIIKRVFGVDIEEEGIVDAFVTSFARSTLTKSGPHTYRSTTGYHEEEESSSLKAHAGVPSKSNIPGLRTEPTVRRALVVILHTHVHIYFLSGETHVLPLPFEVECALPAPTGFVLQRKLPKSSTASVVPPVPPNSFASSLPTPGLSASFILNRGKGSRPSLTVSEPTQVPPDSLLPDSAEVPRAFYVLDPQGEIGLITNANQHKSGSTRRRSDLYALDPHDTIVYLSTKDELDQKGIGCEKLYFAVTYNSRASMYTVWKLQYHLESQGVGHTRKRRRLDSTAVARRRSSNVFGLNTGSATPVGRGPVPTRESFGGLTSQQLDDFNKAEAQGSVVGTSELETLADQLGPDFREAGVQTRAARRVSSMLARADLGTQDRSTFNDIASGHPGRASITRGYRRGESLGGFSDRTSFGLRRRSSVRASGSVLSDGTSFLDAPVDQLLQSLNESGEFRGFESMDLHGPMSDMAKEVVLTKIESFPRYKSATRGNELGGRKPHVFTILSPRTATSTGSQAVDDLVSVSIMERDTREIMVLGVKVSNTFGSTKMARHSDDIQVDPNSSGLFVQGMGVRRGSSIVDACKVEDGTLSRMLLLTETRDGNSILNLEAPWSSSVRLDIPQKLRVHDPFTVSPDIVPRRRKDAGLRRVISDPIESFQGFSNISSNGRLDLVDKDHKFHRIEISLRPRDEQVALVLDVAMYVLKDYAGDGLITAWWEVLRWLRLKHLGSDIEWTAFVVTLFTMAVPFIAGKQPRRPVDPTGRKGATRQSTQASHGTAWDTLVESEVENLEGWSSWSTSGGWEWVRPATSDHALSKDPVISNNQEHRGNDNSFLMQCAGLARDFLQTPAGETAHGPEGYLPTAISRPRAIRQASLATLLVAMHLLYEEDKLDIRKGSTSLRRSARLSLVLAQIGGWLGWKSWNWKDDAYYSTELGLSQQWAFEDTRITLLEIPSEPFPPPYVFSHFENWLRGVPSAPFLRLSDVADDAPPSLPPHQGIDILTPRLTLLARIREAFEQNTTATARVQALASLRVTHEILESLPEGIRAPMHDVISRTQANPPSNWLDEALILVDREDLKLNRDSQEPVSVAKATTLPQHGAVRDYHAVGNMTLETEPYHFFDSSAEADRQYVTRLIYSEDRRFQEAAKLVNQLRPPVAECISEPDWTEADLLEAQKDLVQLVTLRTLAVSSGRGMMNFNARIPLLTDKVPIPAFTLQCHMRPMNVTFSADRAAFTEEKVCWAFFHNGVSTGLTISKTAKGIDTSWILYNKPPDLTNRHAGFLLGLGLNGHLKALAKWVAFKYLTPKHTMVSIGLLLGLSASYLGTMDTLITRLLSVHVTRMLPPGAAELNLSPLTQTAGIMGIGLLYAGSQHRRMSEIMISEIENIEVEESPQNILRDEGYRLAAGFALGFINLGKGKDLRGLHDMNIVERLLSLAVGSKNVNLVHVLDRATAGATIAIALMFMKTNNVAIARQIDVPDTVHQFDYVRPDIFLLRTLARHLILWSNIEATQSWFTNSVPKAYRERASLQIITKLRSEDMPFFNILAGLCLALGLRFAGSASQNVRDLLVHYLDQFIRLTRLSAPNYDTKLTRNSVRNCQDVVALAVSAVMAGTGDLDVFRRLRSLHGRIDADTPYGSHLAAHMAIGTLFLGGGTHTFSTSNLAVAALLCSFYPVFPTFVLDNKAHLQAFRHFWVLAAEPRCLIPRDISTYRPINVPLTIKLKSGTTGSLTAPCLLPPLSTISSIRTMSSEHWTVDLDFSAVSKLPASFTSQQSVFLRRRSPYEAAASSTSSIVVSSMQAHADADPTPSVSAMGASGALTSTRTMQYSAAAGGLYNNFSFEWLFALSSLKDFDVAERSLVLPPIGLSVKHGVSRTALLKATVADSRITLEKSILPDRVNGSGSGDLTEGVRRRYVDKDKLWQLRLLFAWIERLDKETTGHGDEGADGDSGKIGEEKTGVQNHGGELMWLRRDVIEGLRWRIWKLSNGIEDENDDTAD